MSTLADPLASLYSSHHRWLKNWLHRRLGSAFDAEDLAQDTFMRILTGGSVAQIREPKAFLSTVAKRVMIDFFRRNALEQAWLDMLALMPEETHPSPEQQQCWRETLQQIDTMLDKLSSKLRQAFLLSQLEGMPYADIAIKLGVSVSSVKKYIAKATEHCLLFSLEQAS
ncbi:sigma-70 family RNA polymerase sigma factor [Yersinia massiliensis]|jgi:RNA polymerase sigma factor (sigma-70 family)|uniref:RNA polymerase sigma factor n=3 Tax=Yersinia TaxID=629 RepID=A0A2R4NLW3_9GAMM|nr:MULTISPECIES: ferric citrate uptake sigma factor FecI [Yersinia]HEC1650346.1 sigma-70 family RNA polymerase sigma factor [Yersinia enterocolitica]ATM87083.1 RNA polymerase subunit sigma [Yersinia frederiksenii]AVX37117.1 RNA polymerase subunit sigma [Yersinia massiliensis]MCB5308850.1 sigma-70 family RNA polymerase sigma factor [Yersinia massiliensis]MCB5319861.1 sigma-70 family RNA polymerase sigma factor [Yersinia massiliensis]